jgi:hypothetical protein
MTFNVQNMVSTINKSGIAKTSHFEVQLTGPAVKQYADIEREIIFRAEAVDLPGRTINVADHRFSYGPINKVPVGQTYGDASITFLLSQDMREKEYFEAWQQEMIDTGAFEDQNDGYTFSKFNVKYFFNYAGVVNIRQYGDNGELHSIHQLNEAYPIIMNPISMSWNTTEPARLSVGFAYRNYKTTFFKRDQAQLGFGFGFNIGPRGISGSARIPGFGNISTAINNGLKTVNARGILNNAVAQIRKSF